MKLNNYIDATLLKPDATLIEINKFVDLCIIKNVRCICVHISRIAVVKEIIKNTKISISGTVSFPFGNATTKLKINEIKECLKLGANEIDFVANIGNIKDHDWEKLNREFQKIRNSFKDIIIKVIFETCLLTEEEIIKCCQIAVKNKLDFVKTSTGYSKMGATIEHVKLMKKIVNNECKVKASGGIKTKNFALELVEAGAERIGTSSISEVLN
ncbi:deoxyribose-phosphate aldolase [Mesoplasma florum]|uniref:deoxyribose-phosphate aldolase n=1 Tax=Mesoplasma florum TaxID=2151 RepID=UPI000BE436A1|nr:deoxyribose-phosphate aldolase [Mesoplasma florum]ATI74347.1 deoxyribose-phosphate aldolase [Mesoplasma florum]